ncbi:MAG: MFS transporter [FCB group bacterium]|nr:MFS transporter [FCB group bacterium]
MNKLHRDPMYRFLALLTIASTTGLQTWRTLFNNFAVETIHLEGNHIGVIQSVREIPGFLALLAVYLFLVLKEHRVSALAILTLGLGVGLTGLMPSYGGLIFTTLIMSFGFHYYETTNQSLSLQYFDSDQSPWVIGKLRSYAAATNILVGAAIFTLSYFLSYQTIFILVGGLIVLTGLWGLAQNPDRKDIPVQHKRMILRKKYWLYYFLTFMAGARRQIFVAFAVFLLVKIFHFSVQEITILFVVNNAINYVLNPLIGKAIMRFGERRVLSLEYLSLIFIFIAYGLATSKYLVAGLYILDSLFFNFGMGIRTFFQKIGDPQDIAPSMAVGFTINHIAAVVIPVLGGLAWIVDYRIPFFFGAGISVISLIAVQCIRIPKKVGLPSET